MRHCCHIANFTYSVASMSTLAVTPKLNQMLRLAVYPEAQTSSAVYHRPCNSRKPSRTSLICARTWAISFPSFSACVSRRDTFSSMKGMASSTVNSRKKPYPTWMKIFDGSFLWNERHHGKNCLMQRLITYYGVQWMNMIMLCMIQNVKTRSNNKRNGRDSSMQEILEIFNIAHFHQQPTHGHITHHIITRWFVPAHSEQSGSRSYPCCKFTVLRRDQAGKVCIAT